jgi:hypothetical protein
VGRPCRGASLGVTCGCPAAAAGRWRSSPRTRPPSLCPTRCTPTSCSPPPTWCPTTAASRTLRATVAASGTTSAWVRPPPFPLLRAQRGQPWMRAPLPWSCHAAAQSGRLLYAHTSKQTPPALSAVPPGSAPSVPAALRLLPASLAPSASLRPAPGAAPLTWAACLLLSRHGRPHGLRLPPPARAEALASAGAPRESGRALTQTSPRPLWPLVPPTTSVVWPILQSGLLRCRECSMLPLRCCRCPLSSPPCRCSGWVSRL